MSNELAGGRAFAVAELIRMHGPLRAAQMVADANREHRRLFDGDCGQPQCVVCRNGGDNDA